jgi:Arc/MetJ family transcription regulator
VEKNKTALENPNTPIAHKSIKQRRRLMGPSIVIDDSLMDEAMQLTQMKTKKDVVEQGLRLLILIKKQEPLRNLRGKLEWDANLEQMRLDK